MAPLQLSSLLRSASSSSSSAAPRLPLFLAIAGGSLVFHLYFASALAALRTQIDVSASAGDEDGSDWRRLEAIGMGVSVARLSSWASAGVACLGLWGAVRVSTRATADYSTAGNFGKAGAGDCVCRRRGKGRKHPLLCYRLLTSSSVRTVPPTLRSPLHPQLLPFAPPRTGPPYPHHLHRLLHLFPFPYLGLIDPLSVHQQRRPLPRPIRLLPRILRGALQLHRPNRPRLRRHYRPLARLGQSQDARVLRGDEQAA